MTAKPSYEELERRVQELELVESEYKHVMKASQENESLFKMLYEKAPLGYQSLDENGHFLVVNSTWLDTLGYAKEEVIGKSFAEFLHPDWRDHFKENFPRFKSIGEVLGVEFEMVKKNGDPILVSFTGKISRDKKGNFQQTHCIFHDITERKQAEGALRESEERYREIVELAVDGILRGSADGKIIGANSQMQKWLGRPLEQLLGLHISEVFDSEELKAKPLRFDLLNLGQRVVNERNLSRSDGTSLPVEIHSKRMPDGTYQSIYRDITERRKAEEALLQSKERFHALFSSISDPVLVADRDTGILMECNEAAERYFGRSREQLIGSPQRELHPPETLLVEGVTEDFKRQGTTPGGLEDVRLLAAGGKVRCVEVSSSSFEIGESRLILGVFRDVTERKRAEEELKKIKWMLTSKPPLSPSILPGDDIEDQGYGDLTTLNRGGLISRFIDKETLRDISTEYLNLLETSSAIYEKNGDYAYGIFCSGWCRLMDGASRKLCHTEDNEFALASGKWLCHESCWTNCSQRAIESRSPADIECSGGIHLYAVPIFSAGEVIGAINFGYGDPPKDAATLRSLAEAYAVDPKKLALEAEASASRPPYIVELAKQRLLSSARLIGIMVERKQAEEALRQQRDFSERLIETAQVIILVLDTQGRIVRFNPYMEKLVGYDLDEVKGMDWFETFLTPAIDRTIKPLFQKTVAGIDTSGNVNSIIAKDGQPILVEWHNKTLKDKDGHTVGILAIGQDITERKKAEEALRESEQNLRTLSNSGMALIWTSDTNKFCEYFNGVWLEFTGRTLEQEIGNGWTEGVHPDDLQRCLEISATAYERQEGFSKEYRLRRHDGTYRWIVDMGCPRFDSQGVFLGYIGHCLDIEERKHAEEEKANLQAQLIQAQKMEAVGQLAGGVAHDFNNMLGVITGYSELILEQMEPSQQFYTELREIHTAAMRSADLTRQLLTFARKQTVAPKVLDLNQTIEGMLKMLRRLIGENISLVWMPGSGLWPINMDPSQIDQILANLCVNGRDAIAGVGRLTVETKNASFDKEYCSAHDGSLPGDYVRITVNDTGCGMDKETLARIFEPFFTTKGVGEGTGLGLATVYGAVKQNNGFINAYSEPGQGSTFTIYIPRHVETTAETRITASPEPVVHGDEIVLLVEDEPTLLQMSKTMLERLGYTVLAAGAPGEAIRLADEYPGRIHLLATDVIMPEMNGRELSVRLLASRPEMKCLFMSGYTANIIANQGVLKKGVPFIQKPFSKIELAAKVREALES
jgi:PAS domain S-box-containing protein